MIFYEFSKINKDNYFAISNIKENPLPKFIKLSSYDQEEYNTIKNPLRRDEFLYARLTLQNLLSSRGFAYNGLIKGKNGKPSLVGLKGHISISHSYPFVAAAVSEKNSIGIDIQVLKSVICNLKEKFINGSDQILNTKYTDIQSLTIVWCSKEAIYKAHNDNSIFLKDIHIVLPPYKEEDDRISTKECLGKVGNTYYKVYYRLSNKFAYAIATCT
jgi:4'-phosphopantetheinyl transferase